MKCPSCGYENTEGVDECASCQEPFESSDGDSEHDLAESIRAEPLSALNPVAAVGVPPSTSVAEVVRLMATRNIGCVLIVSGDALLGIFSERDALQRIGARYEQVAGEPIRDYMTPSPETLTMHDSIAFALNRMDVNGFRHIPVEEDGRVVGIISVRDVLTHITQHFPELIVGP